MSFDDLPDVASVTDAAFAALHPRDGRAGPPAAEHPSYGHGGCYYLDSWL
jgi:hypothetical protein